MRRTSWIVAGSDWVECDESAHLDGAASEIVVRSQVTTPSLPTWASPVPFTASANISALPPDPW
jgi:hypothetical protein